MAKWKYQYGLQRGQSLMRKT